MKKLLSYFGIVVTVKKENPFSYNYKDYKLKRGKEKALAHKNFLRERQEQENQRLAMLENKTSQFLAQTGIIFSLLSLFIPLMLNQLESSLIWIKIALFSLLIITFLFYVLTIVNALKNFNVKNFNYSQPAAKNVITFQDESITSFYSEETRDLLFALNQNTKINHKKADNLIYSYRSFKAANITLAFLVIVFSGNMLFSQNKEQMLGKDVPIKVEGMDSLLKLILEKRSNKDTVIVNINQSLTK